jgi:preprotein translocase subunit SecG
MLYGLVIVIHVIVSLILIAVILLQAGRGGGLSESFGGDSTQTILGTKTSVFLKRATEISAVVFLLTCLTLAVMTSHRGRSLVSSGIATPKTGQTHPAAPTPFADEPLDF